MKLEKKRGGGKNRTDIRTRHRRNKRNTEARQSGITLHRRMSDGSDILIRESYTGGRIPLSLFIGLGSWRMYQASRAQHRYIWGSVSTTVACVYVGFFVFASLIPSFLSLLVWKSGRGPGIFSYVSDVRIEKIVERV